MPGTRVASIGGHRRLGVHPILNPASCGIIAPPPDGGYWQWITGDQQVSVRVLVTTVRDSLGSGALAVLEAS